MIHDQYLVQIFANANNGTSYIGTGYAIDDGLILTANHVVYFANRANDPQLKLVWSAQDNYEMSFTDADIIFNDEQLDLAVIRYAKIPKLNPQKIKLAAVNPTVHQEWSSRGFLKAGTEGDTRTDKGIIGEITGIKSHEIELHSKIKVVEQDGWSGLSGSPVFVNNELVAIITTDYTSIESYLLAASISYALIKNEKLRLAVGLDKADVLNDINANLCRKIVAEITPILESNKDLLTALIKELKLDRATKSFSVASHLVEELNIGEVIGNLAAVSLDLEPQLSANHERWSQYLNDVEQVCGWLLIHSIDVNWWFENEQSHTNQCLINVLELEERAFVEIIISRNLLQQARFNLDDNSNPVPTNANRIDDTLLFDASPDASYIQLLSVIYKDLRRSRTAPQQIDQLLKEIGQTAQQMYKRRKNKIIYYLVSDDYLKALKASSENFKKLETQVNGYLQFICCMADISSRNSVCKENQASLLEDIAIILRLKNPKS